MRTLVNPRSGYTLPVFACAAAIAALRYLQKPETLTTVEVNLLEPAEMAGIAIEQVGTLKPGTTLAVTRSDPGDNLDLTWNTPVWAMVEEASATQVERIQLIGGEGIGRQVNQGGEAAIYAYARRLLLTNLENYLHPEAKIQVTIILPEGRSLAERTTNAAFGVVEGLSLLGTSGISLPLSAPEQLSAYQEQLRQKKGKLATLVFCIGENGLDLAMKLGIQPDQIIKTANWLGPLLVEAGLQDLESLLLFGYHGKLIKLAGGIFHTHHYLADGRQEVFTAHCARVGLATADLQVIFSSPTIEAALQYLQNLDQTTGSHWVNTVYTSLGEQIDRRSQAYIHTHSQRQVRVGSILFTRDRQIIHKSKIGAALLSEIC